MRRAMRVRPPGAMKITLMFRSAHRCPQPRKIFRRGIHLRHFLHDTGDFQSIPAREIWKRIVVSDDGAIRDAGECLANVAIELVQAGDVSVGIVGVSTSVRGIDALQRRENIAHAVRGELRVEPDVWIGVLRVFVI